MQNKQLIFKGKHNQQRIKKSLGYNTRDFNLISCLSFHRSGYLKHALD